MKFACKCGHTISDSTDYLRYKAYLIADQDIYDVTEMSDNGSGDWWPELTRSAYQCSECGRLWIDDQSGALVSFVPESKCSNFLSSIHGSKWKRILRGRWNDIPVVNGFPNGFLNWEHLSDDDRNTYDDWDRLETDYFRTFESLRRKGILRDAMLTKNGETMHLWPDKNDRDNGT